MKLHHVVLAVLVPLAYAGTALGACESTQCPASSFGAAVDAVRAEIEAECGCEPGDRSTRRPYSLCVGEVIRAAKQSGALTKACAKTTRRCSLESTCGKVGAVVCCEQTSRGVEGSVQPANRCERRGGTVCSGATFAVDGCNANGSCASPGSTTSTSVPASSTSTSNTSTSTSSSSTSSTVASTSSTSTSGTVASTSSTSTSSTVASTSSTSTTTVETTSSTSTSSSVTTTSTSSSTSSTETTLPTCGTNCTAGSFDFTTGASSASCGFVLNGANETLANIGCGGLDIGGGASTVAEGPIPDGAISRFAAVCDGDVCTIESATCSGSLPSGARFDCTDIGCPFGPPLPIANAGTSTCVVNTFREEVSGVLDRATGEAEVTLPLNSQTYLTGDPTSPCPYCTNGIEDPETGQPEVLVGSIDDPQTGTCAGGATPDAPCTTTNSHGLTSDCLPGGVGTGAPCTVGESCADGSVNLGGLSVTLANSTTGNSVLQDPQGFFCPGQDDPNPPKEGCFGTLVGNGEGASCRVIVVNGSPAGAFPLNTPEALVLASAFCIPAVPVTGPSDPGNLINFAANLPGPGAVALIGTGELSEECPFGSASGAFLAD